MKPLEQQVREALQNNSNTAMYSRDDILAALRPLLTQHAQQVQTLTEERDRAREMVTLHHVECHDPDCVKEIATWPTK